MATGDLTTLANVKAYLSPVLATTTDDALLARLITASSRFIESWLNRAIAVSDYTDTRSGSGGTRLFLRNRPVIAISSVTVDGAAIPAAQAQPNFSGYLFDDSSLYLSGYCFAKGVQNVVVQYSAGYATTPPDIEQACIALTALRYKERDRIGQASKSVAGEVISFQQKDMPADVATLLDEYRNVVPV